MHAARGGEKLRRQQLAASHLTVFISTSRFRQNPEEIYSAAASWRLPHPTSYTSGLVAAAQALLGRVYKAGFIYHKAGIFLTDIVPAAEQQQSLLAQVESERQGRLMEAVDRINKKHGRHTIRPLAMGFDHSWQMKQSRLTGRYTTRLDAVLRVTA